MAYYEWPANITNILDFVKYIDSASQGFFGGLLVVGIFIVCWTTLKYYSTERALGAAAFLTFVSSVLLFILGILQFGAAVIMSLAMIVIGILSLRY